MDLMRIKRDNTCEVLIIAPGTNKENIQNMLAVINIVIPFVNNP